MHVSRMHYFYIYIYIFTNHEWAYALQACTDLSVYIFSSCWLITIQNETSSVELPNGLRSAAQSRLASSERRAPSSLPLSQGWGRRYWRRTTPGTLPAWISISPSTPTVVPEPPAVATQTTMSAAKTELHQRRHRQLLVPEPAGTDRWLRPWASARCPRSPVAARCRPCPRWGHASSGSSSAAPASPLYHC